MSDIVVPQLGESVVDARVARWLKKEGDRVETGEPVVELETEKIDLEVGADHGGVLASIKHKEGDDVRSATCWRWSTRRLHHRKAPHPLRLRQRPRPRQRQRLKRPKNRERRQRHGASRKSTM